jgi:ABC-type glycerol-3-phosphate transport system permease component
MKTRYTLSWVTLGIICLIVLFPFLWGLKTSFTAPLNIGLLTSDRVHLDNYRYILSRPEFSRYIWNSVKVAVATLAIILPMAVAGGYALAHFEFPGKKLSILLIILPLVPAISVLVPMIIYMRRLGLFNTLAGVVLANVVFNTPFVVWMVRGFIAQIPREIEEAAEIDGCSALGALMRVVIPLSVPGLIASGIFVMIGTWNNYLYAFAFTTSPDLRVLPQGMLAFLGSWGTNYGGLNAAAVVAMLPPLIFFLLFQKWFVQGMLAGSSK